MAKERYVLYINDDILFLLDAKKQKITNKKFNYLKNNEIQSESKFYYEFNEFIRQNKVKVSFFGHNIVMIIEKKLNNIQKEKYQEILNDYFKKIKFIYLEELLSLEKNTSLVNINENYMQIYYLKKGKIETLCLEKKVFNNEWKAINYFLNSIFHAKKIIIFGNNMIIPKLSFKINKELNISCTYQEEYMTYILSLYQEKMH